MTKFVAALVAALFALGSVASFAADTVNAATATHHKKMHKGKTKSMADKKGVSKHAGK
jgi:Spy/CpxP family protein refolding chaperone